MIKTQISQEENPAQIMQPLKCYTMTSNIFPIPSTNHNSKRLFIPKESLKMSQNGVIIDYSLKQRIVQSFNDYNMNSQIRYNAYNPIQMNNPIPNPPQIKKQIFDLNNCYLAEISSDKILLKTKRQEKRELFSRQNSQSTVADYQTSVITNNTDDQQNHNEVLIHLRNRLGLKTDTFWNSAFKPVIKKDYIKKRQIFDKLTMQTIKEKEDETQIKSSILFNQNNDNISYNDDEYDQQYNVFKLDQDLISNNDDQSYLPIAPTKKKNNKNKRKSPKKSRGKTGINLADDGYYHCPFCDRIFTQGQQLGGHCSRAHPGQSKIYQAKMEKRRLYYQSLPSYYQTFSKPNNNNKKKVGIRKRC